MRLTIGTSRPQTLMRLDKRQQLLLALRVIVVAVERPAMTNSALRGMVQVGGVTYWIKRVRAGSYSVVRVLDDETVGSFETRPTVQVYPSSIERTLLVEIARAAIRTSRTSWVGSVKPE